MVSEVKLWSQYWITTLEMPEDLPKRKEILVRRSDEMKIASFTRIKLANKKKDKIKTKIILLTIKPQRLF